VNPVLGLPFVSEAAAGGDDALDASLIDMILAIRTDAKKNKNYALSDQIRDNLAAIGVTVRDTKNGPEYEINR
jgi:cysteinyl-tRNA synthetase